MHKSLMPHTRVQGFSPRTTTLRRLAAPAALAATGIGSIGVLTALNPATAHAASPAAPGASSAAAAIRAMDVACARRPATCSSEAARRITATTLGPGTAPHGAADVTNLQKALYAAGIRYVSLTGAYDDATRLSVENYQYTRGLPVTGQVDAVTLKALDAGTAARHPGSTYLPNVYAPRTRVNWKTSQQVMVARYVSGTTGTWDRYQWTGGSTGWVDMAPAHTLVAFGYHGVKAGTLRHNGDGTTPLGTYRIVHTFGLHNPGSGMAYHTITRCTWWDDTPGPTYNRMVEACRGVRLGSQMIQFRVQFQQGAVPAFNYDHPSRITGPGSGTGILLHYGRGRATDGCIGVRSVQEITDTVAWLDSSQSPMLVTTR